MSDERRGPEQLPSDDAASALPDLPPVDAYADATRGGMVPIVPKYNPKEVAPERLKTEWITN